MAKKFFLALVGVLAPVVLSAASLPEQIQAAAVVDDGYAGKALQKIMGAFSGDIPQGQRIEAKLFVDADGNLTDCRSLKGDSKKLCQAARAASPYGSPPYGIASEIVVSLWSGSAKQGNSAKTEKNGVDDKYLAKIRRDLRNAMYIPEKTKPGTYYATARLEIDKAGKILRSEISKSSGDKLLDKYVLQGIQRAGSVATPPKGTPENLEITFTLVR